MAYNVTLNSSNVIGNSNSQFQYNFITGNLNVPDDSEIQLTSMTYPYSFQNVTSTIGNNIIGYTAPTPIQSFSVNSGSSPTDPNTGIVTTNTGTTTTVSLSGVGYINTGLNMALNITGATGFTGSLFVTAVSTTSGTVNVTVNQSVTLPAIGASVTIFYDYNTSTSPNQNLNSGTLYCTLPANNYVFPGYYLYISSSLSLTVTTVTLVSGTTYRLGWTSTAKAIFSTFSGFSFQLLVASLNGACTFVGLATPSTPNLSGTPFVLASTLTSTNNTNGVASNATITNISQVSGSYYQGTLNTNICINLSSNFPLSYYGNYFPVTLPNGFYTTNDINNALISTMKSNGHYWYNTNPIFIQGTLTASTGTGGTLTVTGTLSQTTTLPIGSTVIGSNGSTANYFFGTITSQGSATTYSVTSTTSWSAIATAQAFQISNNNEFTPQVIYPLSISVNPSRYTNTITVYGVPNTLNINSVFGIGWSQANGYDGQATWSGTYPSTNGFAFQLVIPTTTKTTTTIGNLLGFSGGAYPNDPSGYTSSTGIINGNSLTQNPPFAPLGSTVNAIVVRCNLVENSITMPSDVLQTVPINTTYGSNINFTSSNSNTVCKIKPGKYQNILITLTDQNGNLINSLDANCLISLLIKIPKKWS